MRGINEESGSFSLARDSQMETVNDLQGQESTDIRGVLVVGAGPAGLMLAYVYSLR